MEEGNNKVIGVESFEEKLKSDFIKLGKLQKEVKEKRSKKEELVRESVLLLNRLVQN